MMNFVLKTIKCVSKTRNCVLQTRNLYTFAGIDAVRGFVLKLMDFWIFKFKNDGCFHFKTTDFHFKTMDFAFKMMNFAKGAR